MTRLLLAAVLALPAGAQVTAGPETWKTLEGRFLRVAEPADVMRLMRSVREEAVVARQARRQIAGIGELGQAANQAGSAGNLNLAWRFAGRILLALRGALLGDATEAALSLDVEVARRIVEQGGPVRFRLAPLFTLDRPLGDALTAEWKLAGAAGAAVAPAIEWKVAELETREGTFAAGGLAPGRYSLQYELKHEGGGLLAQTGREVYVVESGFRARVERLDASVRRAALAGLAARGRAQELALEGLRWQADELARGMRDYAGDAGWRAHPLLRRSAETADPVAALRSAETMLEALEAGRDPLATAGPAVTLAARLGADGAPRPFRLVRAARSGGAAPLVLFVPDPAEGQAPLLRTPAAPGFCVAVFPVRAPAEIAQLADRLKAALPECGGAVMLAGMDGGAELALQALEQSPSAFAAAAVAGGIVDWRKYPFERAAAVPLLVQYAAESPHLPAQAARIFAEAARRKMKTVREKEHAAAEPDKLLAQVWTEMLGFFRQPGAVPK